MALYDPFAAFDDLMDFDVVYQPMFGPGPAPGPRGRVGGQHKAPRRRQIPVDIIELKDKYEIKADIPGVSKDALQVHVHDEDTLTINVSVERHEPEKDDPEAKYIRGERPSGNMSRQLRLPKDADPAKIKSTYQDGVLVIEIGKKEEALQGQKGRPIPVE